MATDPKRVEEIFSEALEIKNETARREYIDKACGDDNDLRQRVGTLLHSHDEAESFLESPVIDSSPTALMSEVTEGAGTVIGRYKLLQKIGEGGFGIVYMAEQQEPVRRKVALKIIKLGMDTKQVIARFEAERQALALMDHPNIAHVLDAGATETGRPYFVMELVKGIPITEYCDRNRLDTRARLKLFSEVCRAVQHAHQKGIIHRDIKPNNVLVTLHDSTPVPKIIDFGIAKATSQRLTEKTLFTEYGLFIGTPEYMSPDQAAISGLEVDTRTDIYSLGVLLYELLTGSTPLDPDSLRTASYAEIMHLLRDVEPPRPSTRLSTLLQTDKEIANARHTEPGQLSRLMRGDLDWIVMKAMEKDRTRRYETALELANDVERYMRSEAVEARPPTLGYRMQKFVRRHRVGVLAGAAIAVTLVVGLAMATFGLLQARQEARKSQRIADFLGDLFISTNPEQALRRGVDVESVVETARQLFGDDHATLAALLSSRALQLQSVGRVKEAEEHYQESLRIWKEFGSGDNLNLADTYRGLGMLQRTTGNNEAAEVSFREAVRLSRSLGKPTLTLSETLSYLGDVLTNRGLYDEAIACIDEAIAIRREIAPEQKLQLAIVLNSKANLLVMSGRGDLEATLRETIQGWRDALPENSSMLGQVLTQAGAVFFTRQKMEPADSLWAEARAIFESIPDPPMMSWFSAVRGGAVLQDRRDEYGAAVAGHLESAEIALQIEGLSPDSCCGNGLTEQALVSMQRSDWRLVRDPGRPDADYEIAAQAARRYLELKPESPAVTNTLGVALYRLGRYREAIETLNESDAYYSKENEGGIVEDVAFLAMSYLKLGERQKAQEEYERLQRIMQNARHSNNDEARSFAEEARLAFAEAEPPVNP
jgi:tetratricopeptide (TPR) repeat protein